MLVPRIVLTEKQVVEAVRNLFGAQGMVILSQVRNGTGYARSVRTADILAISTWPSRGLYTEGFEVKTSRSDLIRELADPAKADDMAGYCSRWWIACSEGLTEGVIIPDNWGVISVDGKLKAKVTKQAITQEPRKMDQGFVCSVLRNFSESHVSTLEVQPMIEAARKKEAAEVESRMNHRQQQAIEAIAKFKEHSGIDILEANGYARWDMQRVGEAVKLIVALRNHPLEEILKAKEALAAGIAACDIAVESMTVAAK